MLHVVVEPARVAPVLGIRRYGRSDGRRIRGADRALRSGAVSVLATMRRRDVCPYVAAIECAAPNFDSAGSDAVSSVARA